MSEFKEFDLEGLATLDVISDADKFNKWMYETIKPFCKDKILEIGSGIGNISQFFLNDNFNITLSDIRNNYCSILVKNFSKFDNLEDVTMIDLSHQDFDNEYEKHLNKYDCILSLNVVEHIQYDNLAINNCKKLLAKKGTLIILVPAYQSLYNQFDKELEHYRRYNKNSLNTLYYNAGFNIIHSQYFNLGGILGWFVSGKLQKNKIIPKQQMKLYNLLVPIFKILDKVTLNRAGLSVFTVGIKEN